MHPAILQTNRTIYAKAAQQLYAKTYIEKGFGHDVKQGRGKLRRQHPLRGMGYHNAECLHVHGSNRMRDSVEPHTFARFESLMFYVNLDLDKEDLKPRLRVNKDHRFAVEDITQFGATLRQSDAIRNFVSLLSKFAVHRLFIHSRGNL